MPAPERSDFIQRAVLWPKSGYDKYGQPQVGGASEIDVRWNTVRKERLDALGNTVIIDAEVVVYERIENGSAMWLGKIADLPVGSSFSGLDQELMYVFTYNETP